LEGQRTGHMLPWVVRELSTDAIVGSTRYSHIKREIDRVEIGYTFYVQRWQRTHVNTACKLLLLIHAFEALGCKVVGSALIISI
jgi:N-acetyltransferase